MSPCVESGSNTPHRSTETATEKPTLSSVSAVRSFHVRRPPPDLSLLVQNWTHIAQGLKQSMWAGTRSASWKSNLRSHWAVKEFFNMKNMPFSIWKWLGVLVFHDEADTMSSPGHKLMDLWSSPYFNDSVSNSHMFCMSFDLIFLFIFVFTVVQFQQLFRKPWLNHLLFSGCQTKTALFTKFCSP